MLRRPVFIVSPAADLAKRSVLFAHLGRALDIAFVPHPPQVREAAGVIMLTAGWVRFSARAARENELWRAIACSVRRCATGTSIGKIYVMV